MPLSGTYFYPGILGVPIAARGTQVAVTSSVNLNTATVQSSAFATGTFTGDAYAVVLSPLAVSLWRTISVSIVNNSSNQLKSASVEFSPNNSNWEGGNSASLSPIESSGMAVATYTDNAKNYIRVRGWTSGSAGALTGSLAVYVNLRS